MKKTYTRPTIKIIPLKHQGALLEASNVEDFKPISGPFGMEKLDKQHKG